MRYIFYITDMTGPTSSHQADYDTTPYMSISSDSPDNSQYAVINNSLEDEDNEQQHQSAIIQQMTNAYTALTQQQAATGVINPQQAVYSNGDDGNVFIDSPPQQHAALSDVPSDASTVSSGQYIAGEFLYYVIVLMIEVCFGSTLVYFFLLLIGCVYICVLCH